MAATPTPRTALGASTLNRGYWCDVAPVPATAGAEPSWVPVAGVMEFKPKPSEASSQDDSDFDSEGYGSSTVTKQTWGGEIKVGRKVTAASATAYDPGQELLRKAAEGLGVTNQLMFRYYEMEAGGPRVEAKTGRVSATYSPDGGGMDATKSAAITLAGIGKPTSVHPFATA
jgi:hypothetical protein